MIIPSNSGSLISFKTDLAYSFKEVVGSAFPACGLKIKDFSLLAILTKYLGSKDPSGNLKTFCASWLKSAHILFFILEYVVLLFNTLSFISLPSMYPFGSIPSFEALITDSPKASIPWAKVLVAYPCALIKGPPKKEDFAIPSIKSTLWLSTAKPGVIAAFSTFFVKKSVPSSVSIFLINFCACSGWFNNFNCSSVNMPCNFPNSIGSPFLTFKSCLKNSFSLFKMFTALDAPNCWLTLPLATLVYIFPRAPANPKPANSPSPPCNAPLVTSFTISSLGSKVCAKAAPVPPPIVAPAVPAPIFLTVLAEIFNKGLDRLATLAAKPAEATKDPPPVTGANATPAIPPAIDKPTSVTNLLKLGLPKKLSVSLLYLPLLASDKTSSGERVKTPCSSNALLPVRPDVFSLKSKKLSIATCSVGVGVLPFIVNFCPCTTISPISF